MLNVLIIIDEFGWAWDFHARGIKKYSRYSNNIDIKRMDELNSKDDYYDVYHFFGLYSYMEQVNHVSEAIRSSIPSEKIICGIRSHARLEVPVEVKTLTCVSRELYELMKEKYPYKKIYLTRNAVDTDIFKPIDTSISNRFVVGWAGNSENERKRFYLLKELGFPFKVKADSGQEFFVKNRSQIEMVDFYHEIDVLVSFSMNEGMPTTILEASACGLPVVSTAVGGIPEFLDRKWLIPNYSTESIIKQFKEKLGLLRSDMELRKEIGKMNMERILRDWTWNKRALEYDEIYREVAL